LGGRELRRALLRILAAGALVLDISAAQQLQFTPVSQDVVYARLNSFSTKNAERERTIRRLFVEAGCPEDALSEVPVDHVHETDLACTKSGESDQEILVGAHFDMVDVGTGVVDNWSGASLLPSIYQGLTALPRKHTFVLVAFAGEEKGLLGSKAYVKQLGKDETRIKAMVNLDTLGLDDTKVWVTHADKDLVTGISAVAHTMKLPIAAVNVDKVGSADSESFRDAHIPAITIHSLTQETLGILHSPRDQPKDIHMDAYYRSYQLVLGYLAYLDFKLE
jgi:hypothetical protein